MSTGAEVAFEGVGRAFRNAGGTHQVLAGIDLRVDGGEVLALIGASGCGKSTLLRLAGGLDQPTRGTVRIGGDPVRGIDPRTAYVFQEPRLLPWRSLVGNVELGLPAGMDRASGRALAVDLLAKVGLAGFAGHRPTGVSGGMAQRTALARALARNPAVLLLDEPFGALDALTRLRMQNLLLDLLRDVSPTVLLVTHDVEEALLLADRVALLGPDPGRVEEGAKVLHDLVVPSPRPRDRGEPQLADLRADLLGRLGVAPRRPTSATPLESLEGTSDDAHPTVVRASGDSRAAARRLRVGRH